MYIYIFASQGRAHGNYILRALSSLSVSPSLPVSVSVFLCLSLCIHAYISFRSFSITFIHSLIAGVIWFTIYIYFSLYSLFYMYSRSIYPFLQLAYICHGQAWGWSLTFTLSARPSIRCLSAYLSAHSHCAGVCLCVCLLFAPLVTLFIWRTQTLNSEL